MSDVITTRREGDMLVVDPQLIYGEPPTARIEDNRLIPLGRGALPIRDPKTDEQRSHEAGPLRRRDRVVGGVSAIVQKGNRIRDLHRNRPEVHVQPRVTQHVRSGVGHRTVHRRLDPGPLEQLGHHLGGVAGVGDGPEHPG
mgnify:CR=1 FL=1